MIKFVALLKRKPGLTLEEFIDLYESAEYGHALFAARHLPGARRYERRFLRSYGNPVDGQDYAPDYDVITEIWFDDMAALDAAMGNVARPEVAAAFAADEARLFDRERIRVFVVEQESASAL